MRIMAGTFAAAALLLCICCCCCSAFAAATAAAAFAAATAAAVFAAPAACRKFWSVCHQRRCCLCCCCLAFFVPLLQLLLLILLAMAVLVPLLWLVSTSLKGPAEDIFTSPPSLFPIQPSLDAYGRLFRDNPLWTYIFNSSVVSFLAVVANLLFCSLAAYPLARMRFLGRGLVLALVVATILIDENRCNHKGQHKTPTKEAHPRQGVSSQGAEQKIRHHRKETDDGAVENVGPERIITKQPPVCIEAGLDWEERRRACEDIFRGAF